MYPFQRSALIFLFLTILCWVTLLTVGLWGPPNLGVLASNLLTIAAIVFLIATIVLVLFSNVSVAETVTATKDTSASARTSTIVDGASSGAAARATDAYQAETTELPDAASARLVEATVPSTPVDWVADDLKRIRGIDPRIEAALAARGIGRYSDIASWTATDVKTTDGELDLQGRIQRENWIEQAQILAAGGDTAFSRAVDRGEIHRG